MKIKCSHCIFEKIIFYFKSMKHTVLLTLALCVSSLSFAQPSNYTTSKANNNKLNREIYFQKSPLVQLEKSLGSPYFEENFENGTVIDQRTNSQENRKIRYNAYNDEFEVLYQDRVYIIAKSSTLKISLGKQKFEFYAFQNLNSKKLTTGYLEVLDENKLYLRHKKELKEGRESVNSMAADIPDKLIEVNQLFEKSENETVQEIKWKYKTIANLYGGNDQKKFKTHLKENNLDIKEKNDLIKIINLKDNYSAQLLK